MGWKYNKYLSSEWWKFVRQKAVNRGKGRCIICRSEKRIHVHHFHYRYKYSGSASKAVKDTVLFCGGCHNAFHKKYGSKKDMTRETKFFIKQSKKQIKVAREQWEELYNGFNRSIL